MLNKLFSFAEDLADMVREELVNSKVGSGRALWQPTTATYKEDDSPVTELDCHIERLLRAKIEQEYPEHSILGEEFEETLGNSEYTWVLDPIDGTSEFAAGLPTWGSIIALFKLGQPLVGVIDHPDLDLRLAGAKGRGVSLNEKKLVPFPERGPVKRYICSSPWNFTRVGADLEVFNRYCKEFSNVRVFHSCFTYTNVFGGMADLMLDWKVKPWDRSCSKLFADELEAGYWGMDEDAQGFRTPDFSYAFGMPKEVERLKSLFRS